MFPNVDFTTTQAYKYLADHYISINEKSIKDLFAEDPQRFEKFSRQFDDILLDFSKNRINDETFALLMQLAKECRLEEAIQAMFNGERINVTEGRQVLHTALRNQSEQPVIVDGEDVMPKVKAVLAHMKDFTNRILSGDWKGYTGREITDVVNIGIGAQTLVLLWSQRH